MSVPRRILVPHDFTAPSKRACDYALELGKAMSSSLSLLHVLEAPPEPLSESMREGIRRDAARELDAVASLMRPYVPEVDTQVIDGSPSEAIEAATSDGGADLVVMGSHGRRGVVRTLLGSVAAHVCRIASVPVTTVPAHVAVSRNSAGVRLAAAFAHSRLANAHVVALSRGALTVATALAERANATVDLWLVEPITTADGVVVGAVDEDGTVVIDATASGEVPHVAIAAARQRLHAERAALQPEASAPRDCRSSDVILVADGLFSAAFARVAMSAFRKVGARRVIVATPLASRTVHAQLDGEADLVMALTRATVAETCTYRDDVIASDLVAVDLLYRRPHRRAI